jgi:hypothetical protein
MPFANDDNDNQLRNAGKQYPLDTSSADWQKVADKLYGNNSIEAAEIKHREYWLIWLLLLFPVIWLCNKYTPKQTAYELPKSVEAERSLVGIDQAKNKRLLYPEKIVNDNSSQSKTAQSKLNFNTDKANMQGNALIKLSGQGNQNQRLTSDAFVSDYTVQPLSIARQTAFEPVLSQQINTSLNTLPVRPKSFSLNLPAQKEIMPKERRFYIGAIAGMNATTVKMQKMKDPGLDAGILIGYKMNPHLSIEAGVLSAKKNYYTRGEEFSVYKMRLPYNTKISSANGSCRMYELPVSLQYRFSKLKNTWFLSGGISNFLMQKEEYDFTYLYTNSGRTVDYHRSYQTASKTWIAAARLSGGYIYDVNGRLQLRAAPYLQIPLKKLGVGDLPMTTIGLHIGVIKELF